ncbi:glutathione peroxidase [Candidatus Scalindua japonica]|uniref:Glutathione peroxidase n=1 Tax=Candidatus Scalindua japonica TaxID=1284222 RepID=A0A286TYN6_9BACT|nr:glutathione peroxidase [Candidatus Scalindua japonica]GAX60990.1 glutathione peroxidase [Candidatus Scalindua japonica]
MSERSIYDFTMNDIDGNAVTFEKFRNKVLLIVNVASKCGFTPQYKGLQELYQEFKDDGFLILAFPANNFLRQEPGTDSEIKQFCSLKYDVSFPMFSKVSVKGDDISPFYAFLTAKETNPGFSGTIKWNFTKFLVDRVGNIVDRFSSMTKPDSKKVRKKIGQLLDNVE